MVTTDPAAICWDLAYDHRIAEPTLWAAAKVVAGMAARADATLVELHDVLAMLDVPLEMLRPRQSLPGAAEDNLGSSGSYPTDLCGRGLHEMAGDNLGRSASHGRRFCRACRRIREGRGGQPALRSPQSPVEPATIPRDQDAVPDAPSGQPGASNEPAPRLCRNQLHELVEANVYQDRRGHRYCRACRKIHRRRMYVVHEQGRPRKSRKPRKPRDASA